MGKDNVVSVVLGKHEKTGIALSTDKAASSINNLLHGKSSLLMPHFGKYKVVSCKSI